MTDIKNIKGAIFDCDGTLLDSMPVWVWVEQEYLVRLGLTARPDLVEAVRPFNPIEVAEYFQAEYGVDKSVEEIIAGRNQLMEECYFQQAVLKDGVVPVLERLSDGGVKMCVATATDKYLVEEALRRCGIMRYFERVFTCSEENTSKSSPDIFIRAASFLKTDIESTVVIEDALHAIRSAKSAGFPVVAVYDMSEESHREEIRALSDYYFESVGGMLNIM